ncbi:MAG: DUF1669 domain-containing protein [Chloroflexi bacterium]|nr:DUF1669 domain-containing protein [Chloroflexota bacterium]
MSKRRRSSSRRTTTSLAASLGVLLCIGLIYGAQQLFGGLLGSAATPTPAVESAPTSGSWYQLYFTDPRNPDDKNNRPEESVDDYVVASIHSAKRTVDAVSYEFNLPSMKEALIDAHNRGLIVRLVTDTDSMGEEAVQEIIDSGIPVVEDDREPIMHDKFVIVDGTTVWAGSWNFTENDTYRNNNNLLALTSQKIVANYQTEFDEMFERHEFGPKSSANTPYPQVTVDGVLVENYFSSEDGVAQHILDALNSASQSIYFAAFTFTRDDFSQAIVAKANAGLAVRGVYETRQVSAGSDESYNLLKGAGVQVLLDGNQYTMHHKFFVIDNQIVVTGSYNFTKAAEDKNDENVLIIHSPEIAQAYLQEFAKVWLQAGGN